ncbi:hypothetical protein M378DRAFT_168632 [Amanita muscaria Koide BX008]|uniref:Uncharacterized protein n=1 Tax=Amanita muscaria (strain Koide BX008) TaxID=946122 RepID=A0A0C2WTF4_AMAMK|nr:hypothetical protein M378DRAFT_168632 [Amanita muscaria Koide BX008]
MHPLSDSESALSLNKSLKQRRSQEMKKKQEPHALYHDRITSLGRRKYILQLMHRRDVPDIITRTLRVTA